MGRTMWKQSGRSGYLQYRLHEGFMRHWKTLIGMNGTPLPTLYPVHTVQLPHYLFGFQGLCWPPGCMTHFKKQHFLMFNAIVLIYQSFILYAMSLTHTILWCEFELLLYCCNQNNVNVNLQLIVDMIYLVLNTIIQHNQTAAVCCFTVGSVI